MSTDISGKKVRSKRVRYDRGVREERQEEKGEEDNVVHIDEGAGGLRDQGSGSQEATRDLVVQRELIVHRHIIIAAAVCLSLLCVLLVVRTTDMAMDCNSGKLQNNYNNLQTKYVNLTLGNQQLEIEVNNLRGEKAAIENTLQTTETRYSNLILERDQAVKVCPSGWKKFGCSCYYRFTESKTWETSRAECLQTRADLVVINSEEEQEFIRSLDVSGSSWIGLNRTQGNWMWVNGVPLTTWDWDSGYPTDNWNKNCAEFWHGTATTTNTECSYLKAWICEK